MEDFIEHIMQSPVLCPLDDQDSPMSDMPPLEPEPVMPYMPDSPEGYTHTLSPDESPTEWTIMEINRTYNVMEMAHKYMEQHKKEDIVLPKEFQ